VNESSKEDYIRESLWKSLTEPLLSLTCHDVNIHLHLTENDNDEYMNHYIDACFKMSSSSSLSSSPSNIAELSGAILFQYLWIKLANIRSKDGKLMIQKNCQNAFKLSLDSNNNNDDDRVINTIISKFINTILRSSGHTFLGGRPIAKILSLLFDELAKFRASSVVSTELEFNDELDIHIIINGIHNSILSLDVIREVTRYHYHNRIINIIIAIILELSPFSSMMTARD